VGESGSGKSTPALRGRLAGGSAACCSTARRYRARGRELGRCVARMQMVFQDRTLAQPRMRWRPGRRGLIVQRIERGATARRRRVVELLELSGCRRTISAHPRSFSGGSGTHRDRAALRLPELLICDEPSPHSMSPCRPSADCSRLRERLGCRCCSFGTDLAVVRYIWTWSRDGARQDRQNGHVTGLRRAAHPYTRPARRGTAADPGRRAAAPHGR